MTFTAIRRYLSIRRQDTAIFVLIFLSTLSTRAWLISVYGSPLPFLDQWDTEALGIYLPWMEGNFRWAQLFSPHNEHHLVFTHVENIVLLQVIGMWNPLAQQLINAGWYALASTFLCVLLGKIAADANRVYLLGLTTLVCIAPFGWQNALWGFQSQTYFAMLLCLAAIAGFTQASSEFRGDLLGTTASLLCLFADGSGLVVCLGVLVALFSCGALKLAPWSRIVRPVLALSLVAVIGWLTVPTAPGQTDVHAKSLVSFLGVLMQCLAWPNIYRPFAAIVAWFPLGWLAMTFSSKTPTTQPAKILIALSGVVVFHAAAIAYARGGGLPDGAPLSRYQDFLAWGAVINFGALLLLRKTIKLEHIKRWKIVTVSWVFFFAIGFVELTAINFRLHLPFKLTTDQWQMMNLTRYVATRDPRILADKSMYQIGHPSAEVIKAVLDNPSLIKILPTTLTAPPAPERASETWVKRLILMVRAFDFLALPALIFLLIHQALVKQKPTFIKPYADVKD